MCDLNNRVVTEPGGGYAEDMTSGQRSRFTRQDHMHAYICVEEPEGAEGASGFGRQGQWVEQIMSAAVL